MIFRIPVSQPCLSLEEHQNVFRSLSHNQLTYGPACADFERALAARLGVKHALVTSSGTTALHLALIAAGIGPGDEVIVPALTFVATANAVRYTGATPVLVDIDPNTWCIDPAQIATHLTARTRAIVVVHLYGSPADMQAICALADFHGLTVIEDAAEGLGGRYHQSPHAGKPLGSSASTASTFSFYANKVITTGEGGAVVTNLDTIADLVRLYRGQGHRSNAARYYHEVVGYNYRLTDLQAAIGLGQLSHFDLMLKHRREIIERYAYRLRDYIITKPCAFPESAPWLFTAEFNHSINVTLLTAHLAKHGVETRPVFVPLHLLPPYRHTERRDVSQRIYTHGLSLPTYAGLSLAAVDEICDVAIEFFKSQ